MPDTPRTALISEDVEKTIAADEAKKSKATDFLKAHLDGEKAKLRDSFGKPPRKNLISEDVEEIIAEDEAAQ